MKDHIKRVAQFINNMPDDQQVIPDEVLDDPPVELRKALARLILEEACEAVNALGLEPYTVKEQPTTNTGVREDNLHFEETRPFNQVETADGLGDLSVVTMGAFLRLGIHPIPILNAIDRANLEKFKPGHTYREDGKLIKPDNWTPPDIKGSIKAYKVEEPKQKDRPISRQEKAEKKNWSIERAGFNQGVTDFLKNHDVNTLGDLLTLIKKGGVVIERSEGWVLDPPPGFLYQALVRHDLITKRSANEMMARRNYSITTLNLPQEMVAMLRRKYNCTTLGEVHEFIRLYQDKRTDFSPDINDYQKTKIKKALERYGLMT